MSVSLYKLSLGRMARRSAAVKEGKLEFYGAASGGPGNNEKTFFD
jgi:hypothetical protein